DQIDSVQSQHRQCRRMDLYAPTRSRALCRQRVKSGTVHSETTLHMRNTISVSVARLSLTMMSWTSCLSRVQSLRQTLRPCSHPCPR
ncbi:hypothetical protein BGZ50_008423, partial [Haplosporangium sp. Z 11]